MAGESGSLFFPGMVYYKNFAGPASAGEGRRNMEEKKQTIRLTAKDKKLEKQERRHEKATKPEKPGKEDRRLAPMMRALKAIHSVSAPGSMEPEELAK